MATTWNPSDKNANITLSGGNLTATSSASGAFGVRGAPALTGKSYVEFTVNGDSAIAVGFQVTTTYTVDDYTVATFAYGADGNIYVIGAGQGVTLGTFGGSSAVIGMSLDRINKRVWFSLNGGDYNDNPSADPSTNTGGYDVSVYDSFSIVPWAYINTNGGSAVLNAGATAFAYTPPSGFVGPDAVSGYTLTAAVGSFALAGQAAGTLKKSLMTSAGGAFTLAGQAAGGLRGLRAVADVGAFTLAGQAAGTLVGRVVAGATGTFSVAGQAAGTLFGRNVAGATGAFALAGQAAGTLFGRNVAGATGAFALAGQDAALTKTAAGAYTLTAAVGAFVLTGVAAGLRRTLKLTADQGAIAFNGNAAGLVVSGGPGEKVLMINVGGVWHTSTPFVRVGGAWKQATPYVRDGGVWK